MTNSSDRDFSVPAGFREEEVECHLHYEDLSEDDELWLVKMPSDIELTLLDRKKIIISDTIGHSNIKNIKVENGKLIECFSERCEIPNLNVVLPKKADKRLRTVNKTFKGTVLISEGFVLEEEKKIKSEDENGFTETQIKSEKESNESTACLNEGKKNKKKKRNSNYSESDVNYDTEDAENGPSAVRKKHGKKHSDTHRDVEIKNEPLQMDLDSFPICNSQKQ